MLQQRQVVKFKTTSQAGDHDVVAFPTTERMLNRSAIVVG